ncbi:unnamed protein product [Chondrus crispus]|uniref:Uncharacterized protein n=1 Tax=Chondrus crispus TaxID=2769 RepID=R7QKE7_CHOCR|nr:unnamed protein product [Chondrus crispus]CDF38534.1 unnamed protein product [Chondrus crispus]|eukprot:XP_005718427.1 unnamed protein product [Chondrus crispus]
MVAAKDQPQRLQLSAPGLHNAQGELLTHPEHTVPPTVHNKQLSQESNEEHRVEHFSRFAKRNTNSNTTEKSPSQSPLTSQALASNTDTHSNLTRPGKPTNSFSRSKFNAARNHQNMELHDASGTVLQQYPLNSDSDVNNTHRPSPDTDSAKHDHNGDQQSDQQQPPPPTTSIPQGVQDQVATANPSVSVQAPNVNLPSVSARSVPQPTGMDSAAAVVPAPSPKKPARMPGTKQCPTCHNTIAAAVAKCPKCPHVFREKKEKVKRSGKRGKKNCPKCQYENPSACSSCKNCKHVFRLKLMDKYKSMRPRQQNESAAAAAAAAAHAAANMQHTGQGGAVTAVSAVPLPAGVATYPNQIGQQLHPGHGAVSVMPAMQQHPIAMHQHGHNVHSSGVPMHSLPQHSIHPHQPHPQL